MPVHRMNDAEYRLTELERVSEELRAAETERLIDAELQRLRDEEGVIFKNADATKARLVKFARAGDLESIESELAAIEMSFPRVRHRAFRLERTPSDQEIAATAQALHGRGGSAPIQAARSLTGAVAEAQRPAEKTTMQMLLELSARKQNGR